MPKSVIIARTPVVVALHDIAEGHSIELTSVMIARWPLGMVPDGAYQVVDSVIGRIARANIYKGEVIMPRRLAEAPRREEVTRQPPPLTNY